MASFPATFKTLFHRKRCTIDVWLLLDITITNWGHAFTIRVQNSSAVPPHGDNNYDIKQQNPSISETVCDRRVVTIKQ